jgi:hypothetical protein
VKKERDEHPKARGELKVYGWLRRNANADMRLKMPLTVLNQVRER